MQRRQQRDQVDAADAVGNLDRQRALPRRRQTAVGIEQRADAVFQPQPLQAGGGQDDGGVFAAIELAEARVEVAAQRLDHQSRIARGDQRLAAQAAGADDGAVGQRVKAVVIVGDEGVAGVFALEHGAQQEALWQLHRHVLEAVDGQIGTAFGHRHLQFLDEQALTADLGQGAIQNLIAPCRHSDYLNIALRI